MKRKNMGKKITPEEFIEKAKKMCNNLDSFEKCIYKKARENVIITCKKHGDYLITPNNYLSGHRCPKCNKYRVRYTKEDFVKKANNVHGNKYIYDKVNYVNQSTKVCIECPEHGEFWQLPNNHLYGKGCPKCSKRHIYTTEEIIEKFKEVHGSKYVYDEVKYDGIDTKVKIICPEHGEFYQTPWNHIHNNQGCPKCAHRSYKYTTEEWVEKAKKAINNKDIDFSKVEYINNKTKVKLICKKHGEFMADTTRVLKGCGCPYCKTSLLENEISAFLKDEQIDFERQKRFDWLGRQSLDFYLPKFNAAIECQGEQHFNIVDFGNKGEKWANEHLEKTKELDENKRILCNSNDINLFYFAKKQYNENIFTDKEQMLQEIKNTVND